MTAAQIADIRKMVKAAGNKDGMLINEEGRNGLKYVNQGAAVREVIETVEGKA